VCRSSSAAAPALRAAAALAHSQQLTLHVMLEWDARATTAGAAMRDSRLTLAHRLLQQPLRAGLPDGLRAISPLLLQLEGVRALAAGAACAALPAMLALPHPRRPKPDPACADVAPWLGTLRVWRFLARHADPPTGGAAAAAVRTLSGGLLWLARKQRNFHLADRLATEHSDGDGGGGDARFEAVKLLHARGQTEPALEQLQAMVQPTLVAAGVLPAVGATGSHASNTLEARMCLRLLEWLPRAELPTDAAADAAAMESRESLRELQRRCAHAATAAAPSMARAWFVFAEWWHRRCKEAAPSQWELEQVVKGYVQYLRLVHAGGDGFSGGGEGDGDAARASPRTGARVTQAMLALLALLTGRHRGVLRDSLRVGLAAAAGAPWGDISPQLFAQLAHPDAAVKDAIVTLLVALAEAAPAAVAYPILVEAAAAEQVCHHHRPPPMSRRPRMHAKRLTEGFH
jgi:hypothetical protein